MVRTVTRLAVAAACATGAVGFAPAGPAGNLRLRATDSKLGMGGPRLRAAPAKITMAAVVNVAATRPVASSALGHTLQKESVSSKKCGVSCKQTVHMGQVALYGPQEPA